MVYPLTIDPIQNVNPGDKTSGPSHSALHNQISQLVTALMTKVGVDGSADTNSLDYKINNITPGGDGIGVTVVSAIHDDDGSSLPTAVPGVVDGYTLQDEDTVYVRDSSAAGEINNIYDVSIAGGVISYALDHEKAPEEIVFAINGTTYGSQFFFGNNVFIDGNLITNIITAVSANITNLTVQDLDVTNIVVNGGSGNLIVNVLTFTASQTYNGSDTEWVLPETPLTEDTIHITTGSGTNLIKGVDYTVDVSTKTITWEVGNEPAPGENLYLRALKGQANTVPGGQAYYQEFVVGPGGEDTFSLANVPAGANWIFVSTRSGLYGKQGPTRDFTYDSVNNDIVFNTLLDENDVVSVQYIGFVSMIAPGGMLKKSHTWAAGGGDTSEVITDADILSDSIITGWTVVSGTQVGFREFDLSTPGQITINSTASETGNIEIVYSYVV